MKHQGDSSLWKSLAVAFGDGLAFGVGVKIAQSSPLSRQQITEPASAPAPVAPAIAPQQPAEPLDLQVLGKILASIDTTLARQMEQVEQRLAASETRVASDLKAADTRQAQQNYRSQAALEHIHAALSAQVDAVERKLTSGDRDAELAGRIETVLEDRLRRHVEARIEQASQAIEERLHRDITEAGDRTAKLLVDTIELRLLGRLAFLEGEVRTQAETIRSLRASSQESQQRVHNLLQGFSAACQEAVRELETQERPADPDSKGQDPPAAAGAGEAGNQSAPEPSPEDHRFDRLKLLNSQPRAERKIAIPLVSSIAAFLLVLAALGSTTVW